MDTEWIGYDLFQIGILEWTRIDCLRAFVSRSLEGGSFSVAANELGIGQPAVRQAGSRCSKASFGTQLFFRTTRKLKADPPEGHRHL